MGIIMGLVLLVSIFENISFADESEDIAKQLAEHHKNQAQAYEQEARVLARAGNFQESADKYTLSAEQYSEAAAYYFKLNDYWNAGEYNGRASFAHEEAAIIHLRLNDFSSSLRHYLLSDKFNAQSLQNKGVIMFGDAYRLPPRFQVHFVDDPHEIVCKEGLELIFKMDDSPACVSSSSKVKLIDRGWAK
jgi:tetratricopeptide (TPR) repeat protein